MIYGVFSLSSPSDPPGLDHRATSVLTTISQFGSDSGGHRQWCCSKCASDGDCKVDWAKWWSNRESKKNKDYVVVSVLSLCRCNAELTSNISQFVAPFDVWAKNLNVTKETLFILRISDEFKAIAYLWWLLRYTHCILIDSILLGLRTSKEGCGSGQC
jgi:hypothetical protein